MNSFDKTEKKNISGKTFDARAFRTGEPGHEDVHTGKQMEFSKGLLAAAVQAGASRQVVAATAAALLRMALPQVLHTQEVQDRLAAIAPDLQARLTGGTLSGTASARRNVACHNFELDGPFAAATAGGQAKLLQRGKRRTNAERGLCCSPTGHAG